MVRMGIYVDAQNARQRIVAVAVMDIPVRRNICLFAPVASRFPAGGSLGIGSPSCHNCLSRDGLPAEKTDQGIAVSRP